MNSPRAGSSSRPRKPGDAQYVLLAALSQQDPVAGTLYAGRGEPYAELSLPCRLLGPEAGVLQQHVVVVDNVVDNDSFLIRRRSRSP
jgi:hypothetical protein